jgi:hypothetical protein
VAVPAVFGYNWLLRQNKLAFEGVRSFGAQLHSLLLATTDLTPPAAPAEAEKKPDLQPQPELQPEPERLSEAEPEPSTEPAPISAISAIRPIDKP